MKLRILKSKQNKTKNRTQKHMQKKTCRNHIMKKYVTSDISVVNKWVNFNCEKCSKLRRSLRSLLTGGKLSTDDYLYIVVRQGEILIIISKELYVLIHSKFS